MGLYGTWPQLLEDTDTDIVDEPLVLPNDLGDVFYKELPGILAGSNLVLTGDGIVHVDDDVTSISEDIYSLLMSVSCANGNTGSSSVLGRGRVKFWADGEAVPVLQEQSVPSDATVAAVVIHWFDFFQSFQFENICLQAMNSYDTIVASMNRHYVKFMDSYGDEELSWEQLTEQYRDTALAVETDPIAFAEVMVEMLSFLKDGSMEVWDGANGVHPHVPPAVPTPNFQYVLDRLDDDAIIRDSYVLGRDGDFGYFQPKSVFQSETEYYEHARWDFKGMVDGTNSPAGLLFDFRANLGGRDNLIRALLSVLVVEDVMYAGEYVRKDYDHESFRKKNERVLVARWDGLPAYTRPVVVITNQFCVGSCEESVMMLRSLPNVVLVGDVTGGAPAAEHSNYRYLGNGISVRYLEEALALPGGDFVERNGVRPDRIYASQSPSRRSGGASDETYVFALSVLEELVNSNHTAPPSTDDVPTASPSNDDYTAQPSNDDAYTAPPSTSEQRDDDAAPTDDDSGTSKGLGEQMPFFYLWSFLAVFVL